MKKLIEKTQIKGKFYIKALVYVTIGGVDCQVQYSNPSEIVCTLGAKSAGNYTILLRVDPYGFANKNFGFKYDLEITSLSSDEGNLIRFYLFITYTRSESKKIIKGSLVGGLDLVIDGHGFSSLSTVTICNKPCSIKSTSASSITCVVS